MKKTPKTIAVAILLSLMLTACGDDTTDTQGSANNTVIIPNGEVVAVTLSEEVIAKYLEDGFVIRVVSNEVALTDYIGDDTAPVIPEIVTYIESMKKNQTVTNLVIPNTVTNINAYAFSGCTALETIVFDNGLIELPFYAFDQCTALKSVTLATPLSEIGMYAFMGCTDLENLIIPESVTVIGNNAFNYCLALETLTLPGAVESFGKDAIIGCSSLNTIYIKEGSFMDKYFSENADSYEDIEILYY